MAITIRPITTYADYIAAEGLQMVAFGYEPIEVVPYVQLQSFSRAGGAVIGAFDGATMVGVVFGYTGLRPDGTAYHRSQRMAVSPDYRRQGIGAALKYAQADVARSYVLRLMCWTYDPLRALNAHLNLHKLSAHAASYLENLYQSHMGERDTGASIDRLWVEWDLTSARHPLEEIDRSSCDTVVKNIEALPSEPDLNSSAPVIVIQIPDDYEAIQAAGQERLRKWRLATRAAFIHYLGRGYSVADFKRGLGYILMRP
ncbi:MAG TPA: GNAT family N-acetyltransferase [Anaerolineae bacterium]|jgi:predicted GNAT superfamily acetyltransferase